MTVRRIVSNIAGTDVAAARAFYGDLFGLEVAMDLGWIATFVADARAVPQLSIMAEGGSGAPVPDIFHRGRRPATGARAGGFQRL